MIRNWIIRGTQVAISLMGLWLVLSIVGWLTGFHPRFGIEAHFQQVIGQADISDRNLDPGWDKEDVTGKVCDRVDAASLSGIGLPVGINVTRPGSDVWTVKQDKGLLAACADHAQRYLEIAIDRKTLTCTATVSVFPTCDP